ncbi:MAG: hypothetical protein KGI33_05365 [Thaumarchaeota archaeon]|nr:hypothetical protein [Nitrososphaerota archaeon]
MKRMEKKICPWPERDPLIDVIEEGEEVRVIVAMPGITREDVFLDSRNRMMIVEVAADGQIFRKAVSYVRDRGHLEVKSSRLNNSVLELVLGKGPA